MRAAALLGFVVGTTTAIAPVRASPARADELVVRAEALAAADKFGEAAKLYLEAFVEDPRPELICNVGVSSYKAKDFPHAARYLESCIANGKSVDAAFIANLHQVLNAVEGQLRADHFTPVEIVVAPVTASIVVAGSPDEPLVGASHIWLRAGSYELVVHAEGFADQRVPVKVASPDPVSVTVKLQRERPPAPSYRAARFAAIATGAVGIAAGSSYLWARHRATQSGEATTLGDHDALADSAHTYQHLAWGLGIASALGAGLAGYLWYRERDTQLEVVPVAGGAAVALAGRW